MNKQNFQQKLDEIHKRNCENLQPQQMAVLQQTAVALSRSGIDNSSLKTGESVPDFDFKTDWCAQTSLYELLDTAPVLINFFRGFWCSYCKEEMDEYLKVLPTLECQNFHYLAVSPHHVEDETIDQAKHHFVLDNQLNIARKFGIVYRPPQAEQDLFESYGLSLTTVNKTDAWELSLPATYIIGQDRTVKFRFVNVDYRRRFDPNELKHMCK